MNAQFPSDTEDRRKPKILLAAAVAGVMLLLSLSIAGITAWYLFVGEQGNAVQNTLPADCAWLIENHKDHDFHLLDEVATSPQWAGLPHPASTVIATLPALREGLLAWLSDARQLPWRSGIGICGRASALLISLPMGEDLDTSVAELSAIGERLGTGQRWAVSEPHGRFTERVWIGDGQPTVSILHTDKHAVIAVARGGTDASKAQAAAVAKNREASMRTNTAYREGRERVGGTARIWIGKSAFPRLLPMLTDSQKQYLSRADWLALSLREEQEKLILHLHLGGGQRLFDYAVKHLRDEGDIDLGGAAPGLEAKYFVVDKGIVITARTSDRHR